MFEFLMSDGVSSFLLVFGLAFFLDLIVGDPYWFPHPVIFIGKLVSYLEKGARRFVYKLSSRGPRQEKKVLYLRQGA